MSLQNSSGYSGNIVKITIVTKNKLQIFFLFLNYWGKDKRLGVGFLRRLSKLQEYNQETASQNYD